MTSFKCTSLGRIFRYTIAAFCGGLLATALTYFTCQSSTSRVLVGGANAGGEEKNPLPSESSVFLEDLTWIDVRDRIRGGTSTVIIPTGGIEQNGPFVALNKHDLIVREVSARAVRRMGSALVAPVVSFVPEGDFVPPSGHLRYAGTISVSERTFINLLNDIGRSLATHGFTTIALVGDSGDSQQGLKRAAEELQNAVGSAVKVRWIESFYDYAELRSLLKTRGFEDQPELFHEELALSAQLAAINPHAIRLSERLAAGFSTLNGNAISNKERLIALGEELLELRAEKLATALRER